PTLGSRQSGDPAEPFVVALDDTVTPGRPMRFEITFTDPTGLFSRDTVVVPAGTPTILASDGASSGLTHWTGTGWGIVSTDASHPSRYFTDSPAGNYASNVDRPFTWTSTFDLSV